MPGACLPHFSVDAQPADAHPGVQVGRIDGHHPGRAALVIIRVQFEHDLPQGVRTLVGVQDVFRALEQAAVRIKIDLDVVRRVVLPIIPAGLAIRAPGALVKTSLDIPRNGQRFLCR